MRFLLQICNMHTQVPHLLAVIRTDQEGLRGCGVVIIDKGIT